MIPKERKVNLVPALEKGARVLDLVARSRSQLSLSDIAQELSLPRSTVHSICHTLVELELLVRRNDQTFQMGPHVMRWSNAFVTQSDVAIEFSTIWDQETELPGATITLSVLEEGEVVYIAARNSDACHNRFEFRAGMRLPAPFTATGKAFLSHMSDFDVRKLFVDGLPAPRTARSVQSIEVLLKELDEVRKNGYSCDDEQVAEGVVCFGASVLDSRNRPIAGVAVSLPSESVLVVEQERAISNIQRIALRLSHRMGADLSRRNSFISNA